MFPPFLPALITPFDEGGAVDHDAVAHNVRLLAGRGVAGFLLAGSNGEGPYLEPGEREALCRTTRAAAPDAFVLCGVAAESVRAALAQADEAHRGGAHAVLVGTPTTLVRDRHSLVVGFFEDVADAAALPVLLYSVPKVTGYDLPVDAALAAAAHENVAGIKDSGGHPGKAASLAAESKPGFVVYAGASAALALSVAAGAHGGITASANYAPALVGTVIEASRRSLFEALPLQRRLAALAAAVEQHGIPGVKAAAASVGLHPGAARRPLRPPSREALDGIRRAMEAARRDEAPD